MTAFNFFEAAELPVPAITPDQARAIAAEHFRMDARITALGSQQDANFLLSRPAGDPIGVLKIANPAFSRVELEAQDAAAAFIAAGEGIRTATNMAVPDVAPIAELDTGGTGSLLARVISDHVRKLPGITGSRVAEFKAQGIHMQQAGDGLFGGHGSGLLGLSGFHRFLALKFFLLFYGALLRSPCACGQTARQQPKGQLGHIGQE
jgi:hypothetical protein